MPNSTDLNGVDGENAASQDHLGLAQAVGGRLTRASEGLPGGGGGCASRGHSRRS